MMKKLLSLLLALCVLIAAPALAEGCKICGGDTVCDTCNGLGYVPMKVYGSDEMFNAACNGGCVEGKCPDCAAGTDAPSVQCASCSDDGLCDLCGGWGYTVSKYNSSAGSRMKTTGDAKSKSRRSIPCSSETCDDGACTACNLIAMDAAYAFQDEQIEKVVRRELGMNGRITYGDLRSLTSLDFGSLEITTIHDLTYMIGLKSLSLTDKQLTDISPLAGLTDLTELKLDENAIEDLSPLAGLINLTDLNLRDNAITDVSPLIGLSSLKKVVLTTNDISDLSPLAALPQLEELYLADNSISDVSSLAALTNLTHLALGKNSISDISPLADLTNLTALTLHNNSISDISVVVNFPDLLQLDLDNNSVSDLSPAAGLSKLHYLALTDNAVSDISPLSNLSELMALELENNLITDFSPISHLEIDLLYTDGNPGSAVPTATPAPQTTAAPKISTPLVMPDPMDFLSAMTFNENRDSEHCYNRNYLVDSADDAANLVLAYMEALLQYEELEYIQSTTSPNGWVYHVFDAADGYSYDQFYTFQNDTDWKTENAVAMIEYKPGNRNVYFLFSTDFTLWPEREIVKPEPTRSANLRECGICDGSGNCQRCGGDMWKSEYVFDPDKPGYVYETKLCDGVFCYGGSCSECGGDGWLGDD